MSIADWPPQERPRERLLAQGAGRLADAELVAVCLRSGIRGKSAVDLARELIAHYQGLAGLLGAGVSDLRRVKGLGAAKAAQLAAVLELARRALREELRAGSALTTPAAVRDYLRLTLGSRAHEVFVCVHLDAQHRVIGAEELFRGTLTQTSVYPREIIKRALAHNAAALILAHNHPSGVAEPSQADRTLTRRLADALALVDVRVLDHFIVAGASSLSFMESGQL